MSDAEHSHPTPPIEDAGSQALAEALKSSFAIVKVVMVILLIVFFGSGIFTVPPQKNAIILRFGQPVGGGDAQLLGPGLHFGLPYPIDEVVQIPILQIQSVSSTVGWYATTPEKELAGTEDGAMPTLNPAADGYTLSADGNIMHVRATARYLINKPIRYTFHFINASNLVQNALNNALFFASSQYTVDKALRHERARFKELVQKRLEKLLKDQDLGVSVELLEVTAIPPRQVKESFNAVTLAEQDLSKNINAAQGYTNQLLSKVQGEASSIINQARSEATRAIQSVEADSRSFSDQLPLYRQNPELFRERRLAETMARVLTNAQDKFYLGDRADGKPRQLRLFLNPEPQSPKAKEPGQP